jgi:ribosomal protein L11 methyltransferase
MPWLRLTLRAGRDQAEPASEAFEAAGAVAVSLEDAGDEPLFDTLQPEKPLWQVTRVTGLFPEGTDANDVAVTLAHELQLPSPPELESDMLADQDWERAWMDRYVPLAFGHGLWIVPSWLAPPEPTAINIILDPGLAFGTGTHATTALCLEWLAAHPPRGLDVIDYGCGSGILAIAALKLGARRALGTDIDPKALVVSRENAERNGVADRLDLCLPDALPATRAPLVIANILAAPLIALAREIGALPTADGTLLLSGLLTEQGDEVVAHYPGWRFDRVERDGWLLLVGRRRS